MKTKEEEGLVNAYSSHQCLSQPFPYISNTFYFERDCSMSGQMYSRLDHEDEYDLLFSYFRILI